MTPLFKEMIEFKLVTMLSVAGAAMKEMGRGQRSFQYLAVSAS